VADFFCDCWAVEVPSDERVGDVPGGAHYHAQGLQILQVSMLASTYPSVTL
jgi:hypothetical protein